MFVISFIVYSITVEDTASFWDCGEFIAVSYKLEVPHPPGAPFYLLLGRIFSFLALGNVEKVSLAINFLSVITSAFTILFLFWTITHFSKKLFETNNNINLILVISSGIIGSLSYTFTDSFWFSAVEAEVYAMSSFFTAFVFWAILKWENIEDEKKKNRWIILIAYMMGLSIGVHLLNLVTIPALALIIYFHKTKTINLLGIFYTLIISVFLIGFIMIGIIPGLPTLASNFEIFFVNSLNLPFGSGIIFFSISLLLGLVYSIIYSQQKQIVWLNTSLIALSFVLIGYSSYSLVLIRSSFNPPIDENNPENILSFISYLKREQYGNRPLFHGQYYDAEVIDQKQEKIVYKRGKEKYEIKDKSFSYVYDPKRTTIFPRMYSGSNPNHKERYREIVGLGKNEKPNFSDNLEFMFKYQIGHMYLRYLLWNFSGRESDIQDANWLSINDKFKNVPEEILNNKARNNYYMIPLILALIGLFYHYFRDKKNFSVVMALFILTGVALVVYLNSPPSEPRERDYIYAGSYYAFSIWIGIGVLSIFSFLYSILKNNKISLFISIIIGIISPIILCIENWDDHDRSNRYLSVDSAKNLLASCAPNSILFTGGDNDTFPLWYVQEVEGFRTDVRVIVLSYFNTDWYIDQMRSKKNDSEKLKFLLTDENYEQGGLNDYLPFIKNPQINNASINLNAYLNLIKSENKGIQVPAALSNYNILPSKSLYIDIDTNNLNLNKIIPQQFLKFLVNRLIINLKENKGGLEKKDLAILDFINSNNWERPIYFNNTSLNGTNLNFKRNVIQEGLAYRLLPLVNPNQSKNFINTDIMYDNMINKFYWRELDNEKTYYSEDHRGFVLNYRATFNTLAAELIKIGETEKAKNVIKTCLELIPDKAVKFDHFSVQKVDMLLSMGENETANNIAEITSKRSDQMLEYLINNNVNNKYQIQRNLVSLNALARAYNKDGQFDLATKYNDLFEKHYKN